MLYEKLDWASELGNITFTLPGCLKMIRETELFKLVRDFMLEHFSRFFLRVEGAVLVFHATGHKLTIHPHMQGLFPIEDGRGEIEMKRLRRLSRVVACFLKRRYPDMDIPKNVQVKYRYEDTPKKKAHAIKYVTRLDFLSAAQFLTLDDDVKHYLVSFRSKRLIRGIGKLSDRNWRACVEEKTGKRVDDLLERLEGGSCPICLEQLVFQRTLPFFLKDDLGLLEIYSGCYCEGGTYREWAERCDST